jgi:nitrogen regulatory protein PII
LTDALTATPYGADIGHEQNTAAQGDVVSLRRDLTPNHGDLMLKVVVAYIDSEKFEAVRRDLAESGITHLAAIAAGSVTPDPFAALPYRGSPHTLALTQKTRLEFVIHEEHLEAAKTAIFRSAGEKTFMFSLAVDQALPENAANPLIDEPDPVA